MVPRTLIFGGGGPPYHSPPPLLQNLKSSGPPGGRVGAPRKIYRGPNTPQMHEKPRFFLNIFYHFAKICLRRFDRREGLPPPTPPATNSDLLARCRAGAPPI